MCFHPVKIRNPSLFFNSEIDKPFIEVPCGHCEQCLQNRVNDLTVRAWYEYQKTIAKGGWSYFDTLTYNDNKVPKLFGEMIFSRVHLTKFFKLLRRRLEKDGYVVQKDGETFLKYLVTTEYGEDDKFTKRPHYHILWFCYIPGLSVHQFYRYVRTLWTYEYGFGWNDKITDVMGHIVNRIDGIKYVVKYLSKTTQYEYKIKRLLKTYEDNPKALSKILDNMKNIKPFYRASLGFGASIMNVDYEQLEKHGVPVYTSSGPQFYPLPKYIKNKLFYDKINHPFKDKASLLKRNELGISYLINNLDNVLEAKVLKYQNILDNCSLYGDKDIKPFVYSLLDGRPLKDFVIYKCIYKGHLFSDLSWHDYNEYYRLWLTSSRSTLSPFQTKKATESYLNSHYIIDDQTDPRFHGFDEIDSAFDFLLSNYNLFKEDAQLSKKTKKEKCEEIHRRFFSNS